MRRRDRQRGGVVGHRPVLQEVLIEQHLRTGAGCRISLRRPASCPAPPARARPVRSGRRTAPAECVPWRNRARRIRRRSAALRCAFAASAPTVECASTRRRPSDGVSTSSSISAATVTTQPCVPGLNLKPWTWPTGTLTTRIGRSAWRRPSSVAWPPPLSISRIWCSRAWRWAANSHSCSTERAAMVSQCTTSGRSPASPNKL